MQPDSLHYSEFHAMSVVSLMSCRGNKKATNFIWQKYKTKQIESNQIKITSERLPQSQLAINAGRL